MNSFTAAPKTILILGAGFSTVWVRRHFPGSRVICLKRPQDQLPHSSLTKDVDYSRIELIDYDSKQNPDTIRLTPLDNGLVELVSDKNKIKIIGDFYTAIGFKSIPEYTANVNPKDLMILPDRYKTFFADQITPAGSLKESFLLWVEITQNLEAFFEPLAYHMGDYQIAGQSIESFPELLERFLLNNNLPDLDKKFFEKLNKKVKALKFPLSADAGFKLLIKTYRQSEFSEEHVKKFKEVLQKLRSGYYDIDTEHLNHPRLK